MIYFKPIILFSLLFSFFIGLAQNNCSSLTFDRFLTGVNGLDPYAKLELTREKYGGFDFTKFRPVSVSIDSSYFEIGFDKNGAIREIEHHDRNPKWFNYRLLVYELEKCRILLVKLTYPHTDIFMFKPFVILMMTDASENYLVNLAPQFDRQKKYNSAIFYEKFPLRAIEDISSIMQLDQNLYPIRMVKLTNGQAVFVSTFIYDRGNTDEINFESAGLFLVPKSIPSLMLKGQFCLWQFLENVYKVTPDLEGKLYPKMRGYNSVPLWIFGGAHDYE